MKIEPIYTSKENSILLKEKGFDVECKKEYDYFDDIVTPYHGGPVKNNDEQYPNLLAAPEHWVVIEWLKQVHGIWISVVMDCGKWYYNIKKFSSIESRNLKESWMSCSSSYEATEAAIQYVLTNLI